MAHSPFYLFPPSLKKAIRKIAECLQSWLYNFFPGHSPLQSFWYWKQDIVLVTIKWPNFILLSYNTVFLVPKKEVYPPSKRETEFGIPLFQPFCCLLVPLLFPPVLDPDLGRETPQLRDAKLGMEVQVSLHSARACRAIFTVAHHFFTDYVVLVPRYTME